MKTFYKAESKSVRLFVLVICLITPLLACQFATELPAPTVQTGNLPASTPINTEIPALTRTPMGCPPDVLGKFPNPDIAQNYIGQYLDDKSLPTGLELREGQVISITGDVDHTWSRYERSDGSHLLLWKKLHCNDGNGSPYWEIIDAVITPPLVENQAFAVGCYRGDEFVAYSQAIMDINDKKIISVWQVDIETNKIVEISVDGLSCSMGPGF